VAKPSGNRLIAEALFPWMVHFQERVLFYDEPLIDIGKNLSFCVSPIGTKGTEKSRTCPLFLVNFHGHEKPEVLHGERARQHFRNKTFCPTNTM